MWINTLHFIGETRYYQCITYVVRAITSSIISKNCFTVFFLYLPHNIEDRERTM